MQKGLLAILHFNPIELYPPIINVLNYLAEARSDIKVFVYTCSSNKIKEKYSSTSDHIHIERYLELDNQVSLPRRYYQYFTYYYKTYRSLTKLHPEWIWYFESISALPASWYFRKKKNQDSKLFVHYHEYVAPEEYDGALLFKWIHKTEKRLYRLVDRLSHTNEKRMELFLRDNQISLEGKTYIFPNYPPQTWALSDNKKQSIGKPVRIVHVGSIGLGSLYMKEFCEWVDKQNGQVLFDIYSTQDSTELQNFLSDSQYRFIFIKGYIAYERLPTILSNYDVGVILYKGVIPNHVYAVSNKLFEYWACGLDIWFSDKMVSSLPFARYQFWPKLLPIDFERLDQLDLATTISHEGLNYQPSDYYCEPLFEDFFEQCGMTGNKGISREDTNG